MKPPAKDYRIYGYTFVVLVIGMAISGLILYLTDWRVNNPPRVNTFIICFIIICAGLKFWHSRLRLNYYRGLVEWILEVNHYKPSGGYIRELEFSDLHHSQVHHKSPGILVDVNHTFKSTNTKINVEYLMREGDAVLLFRLWWVKMMTDICIKNSWPYFYGCSHAESVLECDQYALTHVATIDTHYVTSLIEQFKRDNLKLGEWSQDRSRAFYALASKSYFPDLYAKKN